MQGSAGGTAQDQCRVSSQHSNITWLSRSSSSPPAMQLMVLFEDSPLFSHCSASWWAVGDGEGWEAAVGGRTFIYHWAFIWSAGEVDKYCCLQRCILFGNKEKVKLAKVSAQEALLKVGACWPWITEHHLVSQISRMGKRLGRLYNKGWI